MLPCSCNNPVHALLPLAVCRRSVLSLTCSNAQQELGGCSGPCVGGRIVMRLAGQQVLPYVPDAACVHMSAHAHVLASKSVHLRCHIPCSNGAGLWPGGPYKSRSWLPDLVTYLEGPSTARPHQRQPLLQQRLHAVDQPGAPRRRDCLLHQHSGAGVRRLSWAAPAAAGQVSTAPTPPTPAAQGHLCPRHRLLAQ